MLTQWQHVLGLSAGVTGLSISATYGSDRLVLASYGVAVLIGAVLYVQGDRFEAAGTVSGNVLVGYLVGVVASLSIATALLVWRLQVPVDFGAWQIGLMMWDSWAGLGVAILSGFFLTGVAAMAT